MDRFRAGSPVYGRQRSNAANNSNAGAGSGSSAMSPAHPAASAHNRSASVTGFSNIKRTQNYAAKAAAARLAQVMASQTPDEEEDDDGPFRYGSYGGAPSNASPAPSGAPAFASVPPPRSSGSNRSNSPAFGRTFNEARSTSTGKTSGVVRQTPLVPPASRTQKPTVPSMEPIKPTERRPSADLRRFNVRDDPIQQSASAGLRDEVDMLEEENDNLRNKLRLAEEKLEEADARAKELEKQVASLGEGISLEARLLSRKEAALRQREAALKAQAQTSTVKDDEIAALRLEADAAKDEVASIAQQLRDAESETKSLHLMTQRMILTQEEMEEVVLKRCWLARYWGLAVRHGIHPEIAGPKHEHWSSLAPLPFEVVISAGQKAKEDPENARIPPENGNDDAERKAKVIRDFNDLSGDGNIESMLLVEKGLHELASLKVEDAVVLAMAQHRRPSLVRVGQSFSDAKSIGDSSKIVEAFELSQEEIEDVQFKQAWLMYFWRRAITHGVEDDVAEDRLQYWIGRSNQAATSHDAVDVERGFLELGKLGIEDQLWEATRKIIEQEFINHRSTGDAEAAT